MGGGGETNDIRKRVVSAAAVRGPQSKGPRLWPARRGFRNWSVYTSMRGPSGSPSRHGGTGWGLVSGLYTVTCCVTWIDWGTMQTEPRNRKARAEGLGGRNHSLTRLEPMCWGQELRL